MKAVTILVASVGKNAELAEVLRRIVAAQGARAEIVNLVQLSLPLYSTVEVERGIPPAVATLTNALRRADSLIIVAPEYNGSLPPVLNNAIAWTGAGSDDWREVFNDKAAALATHSGGGGLHLLMAMRQLLSCIGLNVLGRQLCTTPSKPLSEASAQAVVAALLRLS